MPRRARGSGGAALRGRLRCVRNVVEEYISVVCELSRIGAFLEDADFGQLLRVLLERVIAALNRRLVVVGLENLCAEIDIAGDVLLVNDDLCGLVRVLLYPLRSLLYRAGERCGGSRVFSGELGGDERIAAVFILVLRGRLRCR